MPPHRKNHIRRTSTLTGSFYDKSGSIGDGQPSPTVTSFRERSFDMGSGKGGATEDTGADSDDEYCLTGYGEMSTDGPFTLPPSPTQTIKYRYRAYRPKLAKLGKKYRTAADGRTPLKTKSSAYHASDILGQYLSGTSGRSPKGDFRALMQRYRESAEGWRDGESASISPARKTPLSKTWSSGSNSGRRAGSARGSA
ncbi:hypothetical protein OH76DRAFT_813156 [Lentinus brumalis]|uniref:Uncharacterized protein n=1 Tax=Lentinus brumalis TaxID=2498619 RepID=A0A371D2F3_9APHY|nr:hypothetical protein OH76DRAFT_813156 [Polyporus brumalis]